MRLTELGIDRDLQTVLVLGAGASRGSTCAPKTGVAPPLDADFFSQAQRMPAASLRKRDRDLFSFVRSEFGNSRPPTLEVFFTQIAAVDRFHHDFNIRGRVSQRFGRHLAALRSLIPRVFQQALGGHDCMWHERLAAALRTGDAVLSFNYDTLIDRALRSVGTKRWNPMTGYGFPVIGGGELWSPPPSPGPFVKRPVLLLKPHGSLNWHIDRDRGAVSLVDEYAPATTQSIVPPTWDKSDVTQWPWNEVWRQSRKVIGSARMMVVIGYSVPATDQLSQALLRADANKLLALVVVNPDSSARERILDVLASGLAPNATVVELNTLEEFASYLPAGPNEQKQPDVQTELARVQEQLRHLLVRVRFLRDEARDLANQQSDLRELIEELESQLSV